MTYICTGCNEKFDINKNDSIMCPYCTGQLIEESKYTQVKDVVLHNNYSYEDLDDILKKEEEVWKKIAGSALEKVKEYIEAMYKLLKDPKAEWKHKVIAIAAIFYVINPIDVIPDFIPVIGYADDIAAVMIAVASLGVAIEKYKKEEENNKNDKNNKTIVYKLIDENHENKTAGTQKKNLLIWNIPMNKRSDIYANLITGKIMNGNEVYVLNRNVENYLVPANNFDQYITDSIFNEATMILKALGVKKIKCTKKIATASDKKIATKTKFKTIFEVENNVNIKGVNTESIEIKSEFEKVDLSQSLKNTDFIDNLVWYFSDNSIISETIFNERFEQGLIKTNIKKDLELNSVLDVESRANIKKIL
ncbi:YkvA family protein [Paraclostridium bifermentans]|uniref:YkvA family protein n=1 Tax=Paraclostridium bifermentans TaxID=1490 RepID=UPI0021C263DA|nr:DUF1232 domain-containing protein [Paraclostridium bifermentans]GKZ03739.1 hypothetical protein ANS014_21730 [Paraclostridium bifermentans]